MIQYEIGIPCPTILNETLTDDGRYFLEWKAPGEGTTTNYTVFWCSSPPSWPNCDSDINWAVVPKTNTTFEMASTESLKFAVSANGEFGHSGMGWEKIEYGSDSGEHFSQRAILSGEVRERNDLR